MKEADYIAALKEAKENLNNFYREELIKCPVCGKKSQRQKWTLEELKTIEEECGYPVHYRTYYQYSIVCPKCNKKTRIGSQLPKCPTFFILDSKVAPQWKGPLG